MAIETTLTPDAPGVAGAANTAKLAYDQAVAQIGQKRSDLLRQYGYKANFDPNGTMSGMSVDPGNPFGALQSMLHAQQGEDTQAAYGAQERGLHGGLANQAITDLRYQHGGQSAQLGQGMLSGINDLQNQQTQAGTTYNNALYEAERKAAQDAIAAQQFNPTDYSDIGTVPYDGAGEDGAGGGTSGGTPLPHGPPPDVVNHGQGYYVDHSKAAAVSKASMAALAAARKKGLSAPTAALAARSAGLNAAYNLPKKVAAKVVAKNPPRNIPASDARNRTPAKPAPKAPPKKRR